MPEFENLEPFLDRKSDHIMPVAPHSTPAHDFVVQRREPRPTHRPRRKRSEAPEPAPVDDAERLTTRDMEKAYREAMKASKVRKKAQDKRQGRTLWTRLVRALSDLFSSEKKSKKTDDKPRPRSSRSSRSTPPGKRPRSQDRGSKPKGQKRPKAPGEKSADGEKPQGQGPSRNRNRNRSRRRGGKPSENSPNRAGSGNDGSARPAKAAGANPQSPDAASSGDSSNRNRRRRSRRNRKPSGNNASNNQKSAE